jgi:hypothetical protein
MLCIGFFKSSIGGDICSSRVDQLYAPFSFVLFVYHSCKYLDSCPYTMETQYSKHNSQTQSSRKTYIDNTVKQDAICLDMKGSYNEPLLKSLTRRMVYNRLDSKLEITDEVKFSEPCAFEDALVSKKKWTFTSSSTEYFSDNHETF